MSTTLIDKAAPGVVANTGHNTGGAQKPIDASAVDQTSLAIRDAFLKDLLRLDTHIADEYQWIGQRISWLLVTNSFLLLSFISAANFLVSAAAAAYTRLAVVFMLGVPVVGIGSSILVFIGVLAAQWMVKSFKTARDTVQRAFEGVPFPYQVPPMGTVTGSWPNVFGKAASYCMPIFLILLWAGIGMALLRTDAFWAPAKNFL